MRMQFVIIGEYDLEDNLAERLNNYGTTDPAECARMDMKLEPSDFMFLADLKVTMFHIEPADPEGGTREPSGDRPDSPAPGEAGLPGGSDDYGTLQPTGNATFPWISLSKPVPVGMNDLDVF
jgi:hypothetical protein